MALWVLGHACAILLFALLCCGVGRALTLRLVPACPAELRVAFSIAAGTLLLGQTLFILAAIGRLTRWNVIVVLCIMAAISITQIRLGRVWIRVAAIAVTTTPAFLLALYPPVGFDATTYHLPYARLFAETGRLAFADTLRFPVFPQLGEIVFAGALLVADDITAQLTQWLALLVTTLAVASIARELQNRAAAWLATSLWLGTPLALYLGGNAYIDSSLTMFVTLAFAAFMRWRNDANPRWAMLAGLLAGAAAATKYHGLFFVLALFVVIAWRSRRTGAAFLLAAAVIAAPWYVRIAIETGNPVFPFLSAIFGRSEWPTKVDAQLENPAAAFIPSTAQHPFATIVDRALVDRVVVGHPPHNPWLLLLLPLAGVPLALDRRMRAPLVTAFAYGLIVATLDWRFLIAIVPLLAIAIASAITRIAASMRFDSRRSAIAAAILFAAPGFGWTALLLRSFGAGALDPRRRDAFVAKRIEVYDALQFLGRTRGKPVIYIYFEENAAYYCPGRCMGELYGPYRYQYIEGLLDQPKALAARLRSFGVDVLVLRGPVRGRVESGGAFRRIYADGKAVALEVPKSAR